MNDFTFSRAQTEEDYRHEIRGVLQNHYVPQSEWENVLQVFKSHLESMGLDGTGANGDFDILTEFQECRCFELGAMTTRVMAKDIICSIGDFLSQWPDYVVNIATDFPEVPVLCFITITERKAIIYHEVTKGESDEPDLATPWIHSIGFLLAS